VITNLISRYNIPVVEQHSKVTDPKSFMEYVHNLKNAEGFVIRWANGHRVKIKAHEYLQIHKAKEAILQDRNIVELILDEKLDDIKAHLPAEERYDLERFEAEFNFSIKTIARQIQRHLVWLSAKEIDRKTFALEHSDKVDGFVKSIVFKNFDNPDYDKVFEDVRNTIRNNLTKTVKYEELRDHWFNGVTYNG
jgi:RNA ligase